LNPPFIQTERRLKAEVKELLAQAEATDVSWLVRLVD